MVEMLAISAHLPAINSFLAVGPGIAKGIQPTRTTGIKNAAGDFPKVARKKTAVLRNSLLDPLANREVEKISKTFRESL